LSNTTTSTERDRSKYRRREVGPEEKPGSKGPGSHDEHYRNENRGHAIHQVLHGRLRSLRFFDEPHDLGERRVPSHACGAHDHAALAVHGRAEHLFARLAIHGGRLAGQHALVEG
jgi:hypothetical protein